MSRTVWSRPPFPKASPMIFALIAIAAAAIALSYFALPNSADRKTLIVDVVGAIDGRTIEIVLEGKRERVILAGIGFPRGDQKSEQDCAETVEETVVGRRLYMETFKEVEGCRYVSLKSANGDCLNEMMLSKGLARYESTGIGFVGSLIDAENKARQAGIGVWDKNRALYKHLAGTAGDKLIDISIEDEVRLTND